MSEARNIELKPIIDKVGKLDILVVSPDDPEAMLRHTEVALAMGIPVAADPSQQMARMSGDEIKKLIDGATYLFMNEYELALAIQKTGWSDHEILQRVKYRVVTLGADGARIESFDGTFIKVGCAQEKAKIDPTGVGDSFRSGFVAGLAWGLSHERCAQLGSMIATYVIETTGTQEYRFTSEEFLVRFKDAYGADAASDIAAHLPS
jgi:adenosine kinase